MHTTKTYRLTPEAIEQAMRAEKTRNILGVLVAAALTLVVLFRGPGARMNLYVPMMVLLAGGGIAIVHRLKRKRALLETYALTLDRSFVRESRGASSSVEIRREEVRGILEKPGARLRVRTESRLRFLDIPAGLEGYDEVRDELRSWAPPPSMG